MSETKVEECKLHNKEYKTIKCSSCGKTLKIVDLDEVYEIYNLREKVRKMDEELDDLYKINGIIRQ